MKKIAGILLILICCLLLSGSLAVTYWDEGEYNVGHLEKETYFTEKTTLVLDRNSLDGSKEKIKCSKALTFRVDGTHFLKLKNPSYGAAIMADGGISFQENAAILYPRGGKISDDGKMIVKKDGTPADEVIIGSSYWYVSTGTILAASDIPKDKFILLMKDTDLLLDQDLIVRGIYDVEQKLSLKVSPYGSGEYFFVCRGGGERPIAIGDFSYDSNSLCLSEPIYGSCGKGTVLREDGLPATYIVICPKGAYSVQSIGCYARSENDALDSANEGDTVYVYPHQTPAGKYLAGIISQDVTAKLETDMDGNIFYSFKMPGKDIEIKADYQPQQAYTFDQRGKKEISVKEEGLLGSINYLLFYALETGPTKIDGKYYFDLDGDHSWDIVVPHQNEYEVAETCNLTTWTSKTLEEVKFSPLTFIFKDEPAPEPPVDTPPTSPSEPTTVTVGTLKYKLSGSKAIVIGPKSKNAKKLTIPASIKVSGKTYKVTEIKAKAFSGMKKLTTVTIGKNVKIIGKQAFYKCAKLKTITVKTEKLTKTSVKANAFKGIHKKATFKCPKKKKAAYKKVFVQRGAPKTCKFK